ncbi:MAG: PilZ domain-containing protein [bacterium]
MTEKNDKKERRKHPRINVEIPVEIASLTLKFSSTDSQCRVVNISCSGLYCQVDRFFPVFTKLDVTLLLNTNLQGNGKFNKINCRGVVVRIEPSRPIKGCREYRIAVFVPGGIPIDSLSDKIIN